MATVATGKPGRRPSIVELAFEGLRAAERRQKRIAKMVAPAPAPPPPAAKKPAAKKKTAKKARRK